MHIPGQDDDEPSMSDDREDPLDSEPTPV